MLEHAPDVGHDRVEVPAAALDDRGHQRLEIRRLRDVGALAPHRQAGGRELGDRGGQRRLVGVGEAHIGAGAGEHRRGRSSDATGCTRHDGEPAPDIDQVPWRGRRRWAHVSFLSRGEAWILSIDTAQQMTID